MNRMIRHLPTVGLFRPLSGPISPFLGFDEKRALPNNVELRVLMIDTMENLAISYAFR